MSVNVEVIIQVAGELKQAQKRVAQLEAKLRNLVGNNGASAFSTDVQTSPVNNELPRDQEGTGPARLIAYLNANAERVFEFAEIQDFLKRDEAYTRSLIQRMVKEGRIAKPRRGKYQAKVTA